jgi:hypothetical protein
MHQIVFVVAWGDSAGEIGFGIDLSRLYRETSEGGLAKLYRR